MIIRKIIIYGYGKLQQKEILLSDTLQVLYGDNETGKTTVMSFIRHCLFGFPSKNQRERQYIPKSGMYYGGKLILEINGESVEIERTEKDVIVYFLDGTVGGERELRQLIGFNKDVYSGIFSFDIEGLKYVSKLREEEIGNYLLSATMVEPNQLERVEKYLEKEQSRLYKKNGKNPILNRELLQLQNIKKEIGKWEKKVDEYDSLKREKLQIENKLSFLEVEIEKLQMECNYQREIKPFVVEWEELDEERTSLLPYQHFPIDGLTRLIAISQQHSDNNEIIMRAKQFIKQNEQLKRKKVELDNLFPTTQDEVEKKEKILSVFNDKNIGIVASILLCISLIYIGIVGSIYIALLFFVMYLMINKYRKKYNQIYSEYNQVISRYESWENEVYLFQKEYSNWNDDIPIDQLPYRIGELSVQHQKQNELLQELGVENIDECIKGVKKRERYDKVCERIEFLKKYTTQKKRIDEQQIYSELQDLKQEEKNAYQQLVSTECRIEQLEEGTTYQDIIYRYEQQKEIVRNTTKKYYSIQIARESIQRTKLVYYKERVPRVLEVAEAYFKYITEQQYVKIVLNEKNGIMVQDISGQWFYVNEISRGTIEQLYVSIRLAMAKLYTKDNYPMILDDPFVHFDDVRLEKMMKLLKIISKERQILFFTKQSNLVSLEDNVIVLENNSRRIQNGQVINAT